LIFMKKNIIPLILALIIFPCVLLAHDHGKMASPAAPSGGIGGPFELTDQHGKTVKDSDFRGKIMLVFFGFTHCPDICPVSVSTLSKVMASLGDKADKVAPVFITVDPRRDTPAAMKEYLANFDQRIVALTGKPEAIKKAADGYKVYFSVAEASKQKDGSYMVDHSTIIYMMDEKGEYVRHFSYNAGEKEIVNALAEHLK
jgi:cytochrome oxidase Cu insertion factor (SCO1/SenC/PrrC family)